MSEGQEAKFKEWAILELMGHRRLAGMVQEVELAGAAFFRIDIPGDGDSFTATQFYGPSSVYCLTPTTEEIARAVAARNQPAPVQRWELPAPKEEAPSGIQRERYEEDDEDGLSDEDLKSLPF